LIYAHPTDHKSLDKNKHHTMKIDSIVQQAQEAFLRYKQASGKTKATFLEKIAVELESKKSLIISIASEESNLPTARITGEIGRTIGQIKLFAQLIKEGSWLEATIDHGDPMRSPVPKPDIRRMLTALGPVAVFGASNFPLAFSTAGGDTISALAAGCSVIYKGHPAHPKTSLTVAEIIQESLVFCNLPTSVFTHVTGGIPEGQELVKHPLIKAVAFTGSFTGGKALFDTAQQRPEPIPVFAEMGSINPIIILEKKLQNDLPTLAHQFVGSLTLGAGQFCTNPGLIIVPAKHELEFAKASKEVLQQVTAAPMLHTGIAKAYYDALELLNDRKELHWIQVPSTKDNLLANPALAKIKASDWMRDNFFQQEVFGTFALMVVYDDIEELTQIAKQLQGQLTITLWGEKEELIKNTDLVRLLSEKCGRLLFSGVPTGVEVGYAMHHGGPFPATTDARSTSVGVYAIKRFVRPIAFQDMPEYLIPDELKEDNPLGIWRTVDGTFTNL
jgi:acyl-CoA reductase-like NAD-dependent aldehyde dehydrogenase